MSFSILPLLWAGLLLRGGVSLRSKNSTDANLDWPLNESEVALDTERGLFLPPLGEFSSLWARRYSSEEHLEDPMPSSIQLILAVMAVPQDVEYRKIVRDTWFKQAGVCYWQPEPKPGCSVYVAFVIGNKGLGKDRHAHMSEEDQQKARQEEGMLVLDTPENMDFGKTMVWFSTAMQMFPWATHIGKTDMDTYPYLHKLVHRMAENSSCISQSSPYEFIGRPRDWCNFKCGDFTNHCPLSDCHGQFSSNLDSIPIGHKFRFFLGEFYALSMPLVKEVDWSKVHGKEDEEVSVKINGTMARLNSCVVLRRLDVAVHMRKGVPRGYANNY